MPGFLAEIQMKHPREMRPRLIGFCGRAGAGKTFAATHLVSNCGYTRVRYAEPLKAMMRALGLTEAETDGGAKERPCALLGGQTPRRAMQTLGTEWGRDLIAPDLWVRAWGRCADRILDGGGAVVVDDVRFADEASAIWSRGGVLIHVERPGSGSATGSSHVSERGGFPYDFGMVNTGEVAAFRAMLDALPARLKNAALPKQTGETKIPEVFPEVDRVEAPAD
jgi:hypothetical protein